MSKLPTGLGDSGESGIEFAWRDVFLNALLSFLLLLVLLLFYVHPKKEDAESDKAPGSVIVEASWDNARNIDVDMWVQAPGDTPVGYSALAGKVFNLLRDDLGHMNDESGVNLENAYSRGIPEGEYCVNLHLYRHDDKGPIKVKVTVRTKAKTDLPSKQILSTEVELKSNGQEVTAFRFRLRKDGSLVEGSVNHIFKPLRSGGQGGGR